MLLLLPVQYRWYLDATVDLSIVMIDANDFTIDTSMLLLMFDICFEALTVNVDV